MTSNSSPSPQQPLWLMAKNPNNDVSPPPMPF